MSKQKSKLKEVVLIASRVPIGEVTIHISGENNKNPLSNFFVEIEKKFLNRSIMSREEKITDIDKFIEVFERI